MTREEKIELMCRAYFGDEWDTFAPDYKSTRLAFMADALDAIEPVIREECARVARDACNAGRSEEWGRDLRSVRGVVADAIRKGKYEVEE